MIVSSMYDHNKAKILVGREWSRDGNMQTFAHEMLREIYEQPDAIRRTLALYLSQEFLKPDVAKRLAGWSVPEGEILIAASGCLQRFFWKICAASP
jgi:glucosamine 6-phosphate synthetase-like amidotransferase/phosphosugar isomerase protein